MSEPHRRRRILVTGGTGTLGYNILAQLAGVPDYTVIAPVRNMHRVGDELKGRVQFIEHELGDAIHTAQIFERANPDIIVHCAASGLRLPKTTWFDLMQFNVESTMRLFQMNCRFDHRSHFIYISTGLVYREQARPLVESDPIETLHPYGASKAAGDALLQAAAAEFQRSLTILRPFAFTGLHDGGDRLFPRILKAADSREAMSMTTATQIRDFCSVDDIARAVLLVIARKPDHLIEKFNLGSGRSLPLRDLVTEVCSDLGIMPELRFGEVPMHPYEPHHSVADITHVRKTLGWEPRHRLSHAVWELARETHPRLICSEPERNARSL
jgi:nucleoside-diphosphate-sugar epimerase